MYPPTHILSHVLRGLILSRPTFVRRFQVVKDRLSRVACGISISASFVGITYDRGTLGRSAVG